MTEQESHGYWLSTGGTGNITVHRSVCNNCAMTEDGKLKTSWGGGATRENWWGPYSTLGAAIDAALATGRNVEECQNNCGSGRVNAQPVA